MNKVLIKGGKVVAEMIAPDIINLGAKIGTEFIEMQKSLVKIPDLKDVQIDVALQVLGGELKLNPTSAIANPCLAYADESENEVMYSEPRFGSRVNPGTTVKVYYLTQEVIDKSKELLGNAVQEFKVPRVVGVNIFEAREDLEALGLKVNEKLEKPSTRFMDGEDGQVTRITYPNDQKIGAKLKTGERVWVYYLNEEVILESKAIKDNKDQVRKETMDKFVNVSKEVSKEIYNGAADAPLNIVKNIKNPFAKKKESIEQKEE